MRLRRFAAFLPVAALAAGPAVSAFGQESPRTPPWHLKDRTKDEAIGKVALVPADGREVEDCRVVVAVQSDLRNEISAPCERRWIVPPAYGEMLRLWIEGRDTISPTPAQLSTGESEAGVAMSTQLGPAGRVALPGAGEAPAGVVLRLLDAAPRPTRFGLPLDMRRVLPPERWEAGALMPAGSAIGWLRDEEAERIEALSRPFEVEAGGRVAIPLERPGSERAFVLAELSRPKPSWSLQEEMTVFLRAGGGKKRPPDVLIPTLYRVYAAWYDLPAPAPVAAEQLPVAAGQPPAEEPFAELLAETATTLLPLQRIPLAPGGIAWLAAELVERPELAVEIRGPAGLREESFGLEVTRAADGESLAKRRLARGASKDSLGGLPADRLEVKLRTSRGDFVRRIDLGEARAATLLFELLEISGRAPFAATAAVSGRPPRIRLHSEDADPQAVTLGADGAFAQLFLGPIGAVSVAPTEGEPFGATFDPPLAEAAFLEMSLVPEGLEVVAKTAAKTAAETAVETAAAPVVEP